MTADNSDSPGDQQIQVLPYGEWPSPVTAEQVVASAVSFGDVRAVGEYVFWNEGRPAEGGRVQVVRGSDDGATVDLLPEGVSARTRVHEYGGGAWLATPKWLYFTSWDDQRIHRLALDTRGPVGEPEPISPEPAGPHQLRYADFDITPDGAWLICVRENHEPDAVDAHGEAVNEIVAVATDGSGMAHVLASGPDFVAAPRISPDGRLLAWISWVHPNMPWDSTVLSLAAFRAGASDVSLGRPIVVAGNTGESVIQPQWRDHTSLCFLSDRTDWWNVYVVSVGPSSGRSASRSVSDIDRDGSRRSGAAIEDLITIGSDVTPLTDVQADIGTPQWVFGMSRYGFLDDGTLVFAATTGGLDGLYVVGDGEPQRIDRPYTEIASVETRGDEVLFVGAGFTTEAQVIAIPFTNGQPGDDNVLASARPLPVHEDWISVGEPVSFPSGPNGERTAYAIYYAPANPTCQGPEGSAPPLLVGIHGGPTGMARARLDVVKQFWTTRGFAVVDVNYGGSTGFGRPYRELLNDAWGIVDVEDCILAATTLAERGLADPDRLCIQGGSAGGFTVLAALTTSDVFAAGANSYGVADLKALAEETHKFESRYLDGLIGPYPEAADIYEQRSPINHVDRLSSPLIVFQGLEDEVVPPNQSEMIVESLRAKGVPVAYLPFEGEQHGFRKAETVVRVLQAQLAFYGSVLGFEPADELPPVEIWEGA